MTPDLHEGFHDPRRVAAGDLERFLAQADRLPGIRAVQQALRRALDLRPGMRVLDAGCGIGQEAERLAAAYPETLVTGLDRDRELLRIAQRRVDPPPQICAGLRRTSLRSTSRRARLTRSGPSGC